VSEYGGYYVQHPQGSRAGDSAGAQQWALLRKASSEYFTTNRARKFHGIPVPLDSSFLGEMSGRFLGDFRVRLKLTPENCTAATVGVALISEIAPPERAYRGHPLNFTAHFSVHFSCWVSRLIVCWGANSCR
jgi:hypothetical protein